MRQEKRKMCTGFVYWGQIAFLHLLAMTFYRGFLFRSISGLSALQSKILLWVLAIANYILCTTTSDAHGKKGQAIILPLLFPYAVYTYFTYSDYFPHPALILLILAAVVLCVYLVWTWVRPIPASRKRSRVIWSRLYQSLRYMRSIPALFLSPLLVAVIVVMLQGGTLVVSDVRADPEPSYNETADAAHTSNEWVRQLDEEKWQGLSDREKLDLLQLVANNECAILGVYHDVRVQSGITSKDTVLGEYCVSKHVITINNNHLRNVPPLEAVETIAHECHHAYAWCLTHFLEETDNQYKDMFLFNDARKYTEEFENYHDGGETHEEYEEYYYQAVEEDAREYAENAVERYEYIISLYEIADLSKGERS